MKEFDANNRNKNIHLPQYTFDTFVTGDGNKQAYDICQAVARAPFQCKYNPIFIYGDPGNGKTHLLRAIANSISPKNSNVNVLYKSSETFTYEVIEAIRECSVAEFRERYKKMDILLIDDIEFIEGKENTQQEFRNIFQTFYDDNKQIILSSSRPPKALKLLSERLISRLEGGVIVHIDKPDFETRMGVLKQNVERKQLKDISEETLAYIAENITDSIRRLEGAFLTVCVCSNIQKQPINLETVKTFLQPYLNNQED